jgi:DNA-directed RNA polymerase specialized sigma24 family protein
MTGRIHRTEWHGDSAATERRADEEAPATEADPQTGARTLSERYIPLARAMAGPFQRACPSEADEFESAAMLALVEADRSFDPSRNVGFAAYARYRIWGALMDARRATVPCGWRWRAGASAGEAPRVGSLAADSERHGRVLLAESDGPVGGDLEAAESLEATLRGLPALFADVIRQIYILGRTRTAAARALGQDRRSMSRLHDLAVERLAGLLRGDARPDALPAEVAAA